MSWNEFSFGGQQEESQRLHDWFVQTNVIPIPFACLTLKCFVVWLFVNVVSTTLTNNICHFNTTL